MPQDTYYYKACINCEGHEECEPRDEDNIRNCRRTNKSFSPVITEKSVEV